jgi:hypothetical protein
VRAEVHRVQHHAFRGQQLGQPCVAAFHVLRREISSSHPGLVADHGQLAAQVLESEQPLGRAGQQLHLVRIGEVVLILDQGSVAVEQDQSAHGRYSNARRK